MTLPKLTATELEQLIKQNTKEVRNNIQDYLNGTFDSAELLTSTLLGNSNPTATEVTFHMLDFLATIEEAGREDLADTKQFKQRLVEEVTNRTKQQEQALEEAGFMNEYPTTVAPKNVTHLVNEEANAQEGLYIPSRTTLVLQGAGGKAGYPDTLYVGDIQSALKLLTTGLSQIITQTTNTKADAVDLVDQVKTNLNHVINKIYSEAGDKDE